MSRVVQISDSASSHPVSYDTTNIAYNSATTPNFGNAYADTTNTTYATIRLVNGANAETYVYYNFGFDIPSDATITSVTAKTKEYISTSNSSRVATRQVQLFSNGIEKGSASTITTTATVHTLSLTGVTWTASEINNLKVRLYAKRGSSNTTYNYYMRFYGAEVTVNYTYNQTQYEVSWNCYNTNDYCGTTAGGLFNPTGSEYFNDGDNVVFQLITTDSLSGKTQLDNGVSMSGSWTNPEAGLYQYQISRIDADHFIQNYIPYHVTRTSNVSGVTFSANLPTEYVPGDNAYTQWSGNITNCSLTDNDTDVKSSATYDTNGGTYVISNIQADHTIVISSLRDDIYIKVNGTWKKADTIYAKVGGAWKAVDAVYKKENGAWSVQNDFSALFVPNGLYESYMNTRYYNVQEFRVEKPTVLQEKLAADNLTLSYYLSIVDDPYNGEYVPDKYVNVGTLTFGNVTYTSYRGYEWNYANDIYSPMLNNAYMLVPTTFPFILKNTLRYQSRIPTSVITDAALMHEEQGELENFNEYGVGSDDPIDFVLVDFVP